MHVSPAIIPVFLFVLCAAGLAIALLVLAKVLNPGRPGRVKRMPYESGMDPIHDTRRRFDVRFHLLAVAFLVFDVELLFLYPWAVAVRPAPVANVAPSGDAAATPPAAVGIDAAVQDKRIESRNLAFAGAMTFIALVGVGFVYDWRKGIFRWR